MKNEKDKLLISSLIMILYTLIAFVNLYSKGKLFTGINFNSIINIIQLVFTIFGCYYFIYLYNSTIDLKTKSKSILIISIIFFMINIISGVLGISVYKKISPKRKEIPKLEDVKAYNKYIYLLGLTICLVLLFYISNLFDSIYGKILVYFCILLVMTFLYRKRLVRDFKQFKENFSSYNSFVLKVWGLSLITIIIISLIIRVITNVDNSTNQQSLNEMFSKYPLLISFLTIIYAPIAEELMFRGVFKEFLKNKYAFIIISGFVFGAVHVIDDFSSIGELLYIFVYSSMGCYLAYLYQKSNNICTNMYFHLLQNTLSTLLMFLLPYIQ